VAKWFNSRPLIPIAFPSSRVLVGIVIAEVPAVSVRPPAAAEKAKETGSRNGAGAAEVESRQSARSRDV